MRNWVCWISCGEKKEWRMCVKPWKSSFGRLWIRRSDSIFWQIYSHTVCVCLGAVFFSDVFIFGDFSIPRRIACFLHLTCTCLSKCMYRSLSRSINLINRIHYVIKLHNCTFLSIGRERVQLSVKSNEIHSLVSMSLRTCILTSC